MGGRLDEAKIEQLVRTLSSHTHHRRDYQVFVEGQPSAGTVPHGSGGDWESRYDDRVTVDRRVIRKATRELQRLGPDILPLLYTWISYRFSECNGNGACISGARETNAQEAIIRIIVGLEKRAPDNDFGGLRAIMHNESTPDPKRRWSPTRGEYAAVCLALLGDKEGHDFFTDYAFGDDSSKRARGYVSEGSIILAGASLTSEDIDKFMANIRVEQNRQSTYAGFYLIEGYRKAHGRGELRKLFRENPDRVKELWSMCRLIQRNDPIYAKPARVAARKLYNRVSYFPLFI